MVVKEEAVVEVEEVSEMGEDAMYLSSGGRHVFDDDDDI